jgi:hypothetical protein
MIATAGLKRGPHFLAGWDALRASSDLLQFFGRLIGDTGKNRGGETHFVVREYSACTRHLSRLSADFPDLAMTACAQIVRSLAQMYPGSSIGRYLVVDGTAVPAWCPQRSAKRNGVIDELLEARYRKRVPDADYRVIGYDRDGQFDTELEVGRKARSQGKAWRGYTLVLGSDLVTGLPLVGSLHPASTHEPHSASILMSRLFRSWPDIPLRAVVADALWDDNPTHELMETQFGVHLVARRRPSHAEKGGRIFQPERGHYRGGIARITGEGIAFCRAHGKPLLFEGTDTPPRDGMAPGEPATTSERERHARRFRSRFRCEDGCGRVSLPTNLAWSALPYFPLHPVGRPDLYALRMALLAQRNVAESAFASLETAFRQTLSGPCRTRVFNREVYESLIWISLVTRALLTLADQRDTLKLSR